MDKQTVADILTPEVVTVSRKTMISEALRLMRSNNISCIIVQGERKPEGIVTERNVVKFIASQSSSFKDCLITEVMNTPVITVHPEMDMFEAYSLLSLYGLRHLAVVDASGGLKGIVTLSDIVKHLSYESFVETKRISQVMSRIVFTVDAGHNVKEALTEMANKSMSCIVVTRNGQAGGIITERDASRLLMDYDDLTSVQVGEVMSPSLEVVSGDTPLPEAIDIMKRKHLRRLVVVNGRGSIEGLATQSDIVKGLEGKYIQALNDIIKEKDLEIRSTARDLAEKTTYLDNILNSSVDYGIIAADHNYRIIYFNPGAEIILGLKADRILGSDIRDIHNEEKGRALDFNMALTDISKGKRHAFLIERQKQGKKQYISSRASAIIDKENRFAGYFLMVRDVTKQKTAEEALRKSNDELERRVRKRTEELTRTLHGAVEALALTLEMRDPYTSGHQRRVADLAAAIARKLGLDDNEVEGTYMAGQLHDIGKIKVPSGILSYPGRLSEAEFNIIKPHPEIAYNILKGIDFPWPLAETILQHHERLDGSGYPQGLKGEEILLKARILAVADVVEALSSHRPYRPALGVEYALEEISANAGKFYDPNTVNACLSLFQEEQYDFPPHKDTLKN